MECVHYIMVGAIRRTRGFGIKPEIRIQMPDHFGLMQTMFRESGAVGVGGGMRFQWFLPALIFRIVSYRIYYFVHFLFCLV